MYNIFSSENKIPEEYQKTAIDGVGKLLSADKRIKNSLLYFTMGKGKTITATQIAVNAQSSDLIEKVLIIAPPSTHQQWTELLGKYLKVPFKVVSSQWLGRNQRFLQNDFSKALVIVDEVHQSANRGKVLTKVVTRLIKLCFGAVLMSGTPFRNKEERLYVVHNWLFEGVESYESWLHRYCNTEPDRFAYYPKFISFKAGGIEEFLEHIDDPQYPRIFIEKESLVFKTIEINLPMENKAAELLKTYSIYGSNRIQISNSVRQKLAYLNYLKYCEYINRDDSGEIALYVPRQDVLDVIKKYADRNPIVYSFSSKVSKLYFENYKGVAHRVDGKTSQKKKENTINVYKKKGGIMFATDSISTGTDGLQEATNTIIILDDTMDDTNREQLIGRIAGGFRNSGEAEVIFIKIQ